MDSVENSYQEFIDELNNMVIAEKKDNLKYANTYNGYYTSDSNKMYLTEIRKYPLLSKEEEIELLKKIMNPHEIKLLLFENKNGYNISLLNTELLFKSLCSSESYKIIIESLVSYYNNSYTFTNKSVLDKLLKYKKLSFNKNRPLNEEELLIEFDVKKSINNLDEKELLKQTKKFIEYKSAFNKLFVSNLRLVVHIAKKYRCNIELLDLINEGNLGLMKAIENFDISLGFAFSTYAAKCIKQSIKRAIYKHDSSIRIPENYKASLIKFRKDLECLKMKENRNLTKEEISKKLSIPLNIVEDYFNSMLQIISLDEPLDSENNLTIMDCIMEEEVLENKVAQDTLKIDINSLFKALNEKEINVIKMRYGIGEYANQPTSVLSVANKMSLLPASVVKIERTALLKMRNFSQVNKECECLKEYIK